MLSLAKISIDTDITILTPTSSFKIKVLLSLIIAALLVVAKILPFWYLETSPISVNDYCAWALYFSLQNVTLYF